MGEGERCVIRKPISRTLVDRNARKKTTNAITVPSLYPCGVHVKITNTATQNARADISKALEITFSLILAGLTLTNEQVEKRSLVRFCKASKAN